MSGMTGGRLWRKISWWMCGGQLLLALVATGSMAQSIRVRAMFSSDSVKIGEPIELYMSARYPEKYTVLFPDSSFSFAPFEFQKKRYVATHTVDGISRDSVIYTLATYEIDSVQTLKLPVFVVNARDCTQVFSNTDTVFFRALVKAIPDSLAAEKLPLKTNTNYLGVRWNLNYILAAIVGGLVLVAAIIVWLVFGQRIRRYFKLKKMTRHYEAFLAKFDQSLHRLDERFSPQQAEATLLIWKSYLETLMGKPYTKYTSKEIRQVAQNDQLGHALAAIDRMIYGQIAEQVQAPFADLKSYVRQQFEQKKSDISHG